MFGGWGGAPHFSRLGRFAPLPPPSRALLLLSLFFFLPLPVPPPLLCPAAVPAARARAFDTSALPRASSPFVAVQAIKGALLFFVIIWAFRLWRSVSTVPRVSQLDRVRVGSARPGGRTRSRPCVDGGHELREGRIRAGESGRPGGCVRRPAISVGRQRASLRCRVASPRDRAPRAPSASQRRPCERSALPEKLP